MLNLVTDLGEMDLVFSPDLESLRDEIRRRESEL